MRWTDPQHLEFFKNQLPEYKLTIKQQRRGAQAKLVQKAFFERWPAELALWPDQPRDRTLTQEQKDELKTYIEKTNSIHCVTIVNGD